MAGPRLFLHSVASALLGVLLLVLVATYVFVEFFVIPSQLSDLKNLSLLVLLLYVLPSVPGAHGSETRKPLFLSVTSLFSLGSLRVPSKGPG